jgi:Carboxypeptidase regulatory-like domain
MLAGALRGAVIRGAVVEHQTGKFLARATVVAQPIAGTPGNTVSMRTNVSGLFEFSALAPGTYVVKVSRPGFMPLEYGQKRWNSAGLPLIVDDSVPAFLAMRLYRWAAISGTVVDENDIGLPEHDVVAYRNTRPPQLAARTRSDERGVYRISGLEPGQYLIRTAGAQYEEGAFLPTFGKESIPVENARVVDVDVDQQANNIDVRPLPGKLFKMAGTLVAEIPQMPEPPPVPIKVTLATDMGRQVVNTVATDLNPIAPFQFAGITPGAFEIYAEAPIPPDPVVKLQGVYSSSTIRDDVEKMPLAMSSRASVSFDVRGGPVRGLESGEVQLQARRKDLAGEGETIKVKFVKGSAQLAPGRWEVRLIPPAGYYVSGFSGNGPNRASRVPAEAWNEITVTTYGIFVRFTLSTGGSALTGVVKDGSRLAAGAPVFLELWDPNSRQRLVELRSTRTDANGGYSFRDIPPGDYRVLATYEYRNPDSAAMEIARATTLHIEAHNDLQRDIDLYVIP